MTPRKIAAELRRVAAYGDSAAELSDLAFYTQANMRMPGEYAFGDLYQLRTFWLFVAETLENP